MKQKPTEEQENAINHEGNCVITAAAGSGKTFVLSKKIRNSLAELPDYQGVIAISYTNKASDELKHRCLSNGLNPKASFFGTIDKFCIFEIIIPFGKQLYNIPTQTFKVISKDDLIIQEKNSPVHLILDYLQRGIIVIDIKDCVYQQAIEVFDKSLACRNYLKSRYTHIFIDEYQDVGEIRHTLFEKFRSLNLKMIVVGDPNQSIFRFGGSDPKFLISLTNEEGFVHFQLTHNLRCHDSIVNYASRLLDNKAELRSSSEIRVFEKKIKGNEKDIAEWVVCQFPKFMETYHIQNRSNIAILVKSNESGNRYSKYLADLNISHKLWLDSYLSKDLGLWSRVFDQVLIYLHNPKANLYELLDRHLDRTNPSFKKAHDLAIKTKEEFNISPDYSKKIADSMISIASLIYPKAKNKQALNKLKVTLDSGTDELKKLYAPTDENQIQIMTLHKSKGLEFDIVFNVDLYEFIFPKKNNDEFQELEQDKDLHYVGITRAKEVCVLSHSTRRTKYDGQEINGSPSEFLLCSNELNKLRKKL